MRYPTPPRQSLAWSAGFPHAESSRRSSARTPTINGEQMPEPADADARFRGVRGAETGDDGRMPSREAGVVAGGAARSHPPQLRACPVGVGPACFSVVRAVAASLVLCAGSPRVARLSSRVRAPVRQAPALAGIQLAAAWRSIKAVVATLPAISSVSDEDQVSVPSPASLPLAPVERRWWTPLTRGCGAGPNGGRLGPNSAPEAAAKHDLRGPRA